MQERMARIKAESQAAQQPQPAPSKKAPSKKAPNPQPPSAAFSPLEQALSIQSINENAKALADKPGVREIGSFAKNGAQLAEQLGEVAASFAFPLAVSEFRANGFDNPEKIIMKFVADAALLGIPATKAFGVLSKVAGAGFKSNKLANAGNFLTAPYVSQNAGGRIGGQAAANAADNVFATGMQQGIEAASPGQQFGDRDAMDYLAEQAISLLGGAAAGGVAGASSYGKIGPYESKIAQKTKAKPDSKKQEAFDMAGRADDFETNKDFAVALIRKHGIDGKGIPLSWPQINENIAKEINFWNSEAGKRAAGTIPAQGIPVRKPVFESDAAEKKWVDNVNKFLGKNRLGKFDGVEIVLNPGVSIAEVESTLKGMRQGDFTTKGIKDWKETVRISMRDARGGDQPFEMVRKGTADDGSYGYAMAKLHDLKNTQTILNYTQGGFGYNETPSIWQGWKQQVSPNHRPAIGFMDTDLEIIPRGLVQSGINLYDESGNIKKLAEKPPKFFEAFQEGENAGIFEGFKKKPGLGE